MVNDDKKRERRRKGILLHVIRKSPTPSETRLTAILNRKKPKLVWDSNPACPDRMSSLFYLCHHHFPESESLSEGHLRNSINEMEKKFGILEL